MTRPRVAIAHDYLTQRGGAERVVLAIARAFPGARIHTSVYEPDGTYPEFADLEVVTTPLQRVAPLRRDPRRALPVLAPVVGRHRIDADLVVASSSGWAHGFDTDGRVLVYCHAPARWLYQPENYLGGPRWRSPKGLALAALTPWLRRWDAAAAARADRYLANSRVVRDRIREAYGIEAEVLAPPFGIDADGALEPVAPLADWADEGYLLIVSRLLPYKNVGAAIEAVRGTGHRLVVVGDGPLRAEIASSAPPNVRLARDLTDAQLRWVYAHATCLLAPSLEDFGLTPLEAAAAGVPTVALRAGGYLDTVLEGRTGVFVDEVTPRTIAAGIAAAEQTRWDPAAIRAHATSFGEDRFAQRVRALAAELGTNVPEPR